MKKLYLCGIEFEKVPLWGTRFAPNKVATMEEIITFSGRGHGGTGSRIGRVTKLVKPFWPIQKEANSESISIKHSRYSERRIEAGMEAIIENLMKEPEGTWVSRVTLKQRSRSSVGDTGLLNFSLR